MGFVWECGSLWSGVGVGFIVGGGGRGSSNEDRNERERYEGILTLFGIRIIYHTATFDISFHSELAVQ